MDSLTVRTILESLLHPAPTLRPRFHLSRNNLIEISSPSAHPRVVGAVVLFYNKIKDVHCGPDAEKYLGDK
jgi:hypothetical protein